jgi:ankyrin repeat protein
MHTTIIKCNSSINLYNLYNKYSKLCNYKEFNKYLVKDSTDPNLPIGTIHPIYFAIENSDSGLLKLLLKHPRINPNDEINCISHFPYKHIIEFCNFITPLFYAIKKGNTKIIKLLLDHPQLDPNRVIIWKPPLMYSIIYRHYESVKLLLKHPKINPHYRIMILGTKTISNMFVANKYGNKEIIKLVTNSIINMNKLSIITLLYIDKIHYNKWIADKPTILPLPMELIYKIYGFM